MIENLKILIGTSYASWYAKHNCSEYIFEIASLHRTDFELPMTNALSSEKRRLRILPLDIIRRTEEHSDLSLPCHLQHGFCSFCVHFNCFEGVSFPSGSYNWRSGREYQRRRRHLGSGILYRAHPPRETKTEEKFLRPVTLFRSP